MRTLDTYGREEEEEPLVEIAVTAATGSKTIVHSRGRRVLWGCETLLGDLLFPNVDQSVPDQLTISFASLRTFRFWYK